MNKKMKLVDVKLGTYMKYGFEHSDKHPKLKVCAGEEHQNIKIFSRRAALQIILMKSL